MPRRSKRTTVANRAPSIGTGDDSPTPSPRLLLEGRPSLLIGEQWIEPPKGSFIRIPVGVMHDFEIRTDELIGLLNVFIAGGFEQMMPMVVQWFDENR